MSAVAEVSPRVAALAEALFTTQLQCADLTDVGYVQVAVAFQSAMLTEREIAERVAQEFGDHPEQAASRMRCCLRAVREAFASENVR